MDDEFKKPFKKCPSTKINIIEKTDETNMMMVNDEEYKKPETLIELRNLRMGSLLESTNAYMKIMSNILEYKSAALKKQGDLECKMKNLKREMKILKDKLDENTKGIENFTLMEQVHEKNLKSMEDIFYKSYPSLQMISSNLTQNLNPSKLNTISGKISSSDNTIPDKDDKILNLLTLGELHLQDNMPEMNETTEELSAKNSLANALNTSENIGQNNPELLRNTNINPTTEKRRVSDEDDGTTTTKILKITTHQNP